MSLMLDAARVAAGLNILLLLFVIGIWVNTYREIRAPFTLASVVFAGFLLAENIVALFFYFNAPAMPAVAEQFGQAWTWARSSANTRANRSETCRSQWLQVAMVGSSGSRSHL